MFGLHSIRWRIAVPYVILAVLAMAGLAVYLSDLVRNAHLADLEAQLTAEAQLLGETLAAPLAQGKPGEIFDAQARHYADLLGVRVTIIATDGTVLGESHEDRLRMDNHLYRPEVQEALANGQGSSIRFSQTVRYEMMYVAVPVTAEGRETGIVRVALPLRQIEANLSRLRRAVLSATVVTSLIAVLLALLIAERTSRPLRQLTHMAERMAEGDLSARLLSRTRDEVGLLSDAFNRMAGQLQEKMTTLDRERSRLAAVLTHMADGVVITDAEGQVVLINPAAARLLGTTEKSALEASFARVVRDHQLIELWKRCRETGAEEMEAVEVDHHGPFLQAIVTPLLEGERQGFMVILQDLTQIRRLETVRRDFISNLSHELRTPLASLKALVETLRDGALQDPPAAKRFLDRIEAEVDALTQMVQELLELSRIESGQAPFHPAPVAVGDLVLPVIERLRPQADRTSLRLTVEVPPDLPPVLADPERVQQVVTNLVHNAIKFTPSGGEVTITAARSGQEMVISVNDTGVGISAEDLPRIFERFYKADRARSGGGTGLGLAIAKHIVKAHGGRIWAESIEGQGSTFFFTLLPAEQEDEEGR